MCQVPSLYGKCRVYRNSLNLIFAHNFMMQLSKKFHASVSAYRESHPIETHLIEVINEMNLIKEKYPSTRCHEGLQRRQGTNTRSAKR